MRFVSESQPPLNVPVRWADRPGMIDLELELVRENPSWIAVLKAYQAAQEELAARQAEAAGQSAQSEKSTSSNDAPEGQSGSAEAEEAGLETDLDSESDAENEDRDASPKKRATRWVQRITKLTGVTPEELSKIHGRLIAYDLLKCDLAGRSDGMVYQLTSTGKTILNRCEDTEEVDTDDRSAA